ncbi:MAG TPA: right-handed parallel beta-helix repeat-containing protein [Bradyrhizobium sp.]
MKRFLTVPFGIAGAIIALFLLASPASAQASRTWVSGVGDDANPCSRTAPCKTFAGAISKTAVNGEINCIDPGGFGAVTITKSITIDCHEVFSSILNAGTNGINIAFDSFSDVRKTVNIRNINLQGFDSGIIGIRIFGAGAGSFVNIEDCLVNGDFSSTATGIADQRTNGTLNVVNTTVRDMGGSGITVASAGGGLISATLSNVRVINAASGIAVGTGGAVHLSNSLVSSNSVGGIVISGGGINVDATTISFNLVGIKQTGGSVNLSNNDVSFNSTGVSGTVNSYTNNRFTSNGGGGTITAIGGVTNPSGLQ